MLKKSPSHQELAGAHRAVKANFFKQGPTLPYTTLHFQVLLLLLVTID